MLIKYLKHVNPIIIFLLLLEACAPTLPAFQKSNLDLPSTFPNEGTNQTSSADILWQNFFNDPNLIILIENALKNNQELAILEQEINIANNEIMSRRGEYLPKFNAGGSGGVEKTERFSSEDANSPTKFGRFGITTTWEIDIWKKLRNATKAAYYNYLSSIEGRKYVITNVVAEVANTYFELMALDNQLKIISQYIEILTQIKDMVKLQQTAARTTSLAVKRFEAEVFKNISRKYSVEQQIIVTQNKLNLLQGRFPQNIKRDSNLFSDLNLASISTSVPSKLLNNRPDVKKAILELEESRINLDVARARFYPSLSIEGGIGYEQFNSKHFEGSPTTMFYGLAANLTAPLLNRMAIKADYFSANNKQIQAIYNYELSIIKAYTEVANQLTILKNLEKIYISKHQQVLALNESIEISNILFKAARVDYIESLFTQRDSLEAQVELIEIKKQQLIASVDLYKSLGGGWK